MSLGALLAGCGLYMARGRWRGYSDPEWSVVAVFLVLGLPLLAGGHLIMRSRQR